MRLNFDMAKVLPLVGHAKLAQQSPILNDLFDAGMLKEGRTLNANGIADADDVDWSKIPPRLVLVNDAGVYLMCSTEPQLLDAHGHCQVVYAEGFSDKEGGLPGDDFAETIEIDAIERMAEGFTQARRKLGVSAAPPTQLVVNISTTQIEFFVA